MEDYKSTNTGANIDKAIAWALKHLGIDVSTFYAAFQKLATQVLNAVATATGVKVTYKLADYDEITATIPLATNSLAGCMSPEDKTEMEKLKEVGVDTIVCGLVINRNGIQNLITLDQVGGEQLAAPLTAATSQYAGLLTATDKKRLDSIYNTFDDLIESITMTERATDIYLEVKNAAGEDMGFSVNGATTELAGVMTAQDKTRLGKMWDYMVSQGWVKD